MKKVFKLAAIAIVAMAMTTACNNNTEAVEDTIIEDTIVEEIAEDTIEEEVVAEETPAAKPAAKPAKKAEVKVEAPADVKAAAEGKKSLSISAGNTNVTVGEGGSVQVSAGNTQEQNKSKKVSVKVNQ